MNLWQQIEQHPANQIAVIDDESRKTYGALRDDVASLIHSLPQQRQLILLLADNSYQTLVRYLSCLASHHPVIVVASNLPSETIQQLVETYQPNLIFRPNQVEPENNPSLIHQLADELAVMLTTSGSTGRAKLVRLSLKNITANASSICRYLQMESSHLAMTALPFAYSYGLSVINSHLLCAAAIRLTNATPMEKDFWQILKSEPITQLTGVPYSYQMYEQLRFRRQSFPHLKILTQAGGKLAPEMVALYADWAKENDVRFYVMYGQTEATARMTYLPPQYLEKHPDSIGIPIPDGEMHILDENGNPIDTPNVVGEFQYAGPNVMLGYAENRHDLADPESLTSLQTGDLGYRNELGLLFVTGRLKRQIKLAGVRWQLDELEKLCTQKGWSVVCTGRDQLLRVACLHEQEIQEIRHFLHQTQQLHPSLFQLKHMTEIPRTVAGKIDFPALNQLFELGE